MIRVYVAGKYSADNVIGVLTNIEAGMNEAAYLIGDGYAVYCPWLDHSLIFTAHGRHLDEIMLKDNAMAWLEVSDAVLVIPGWEKSKGTHAEIARAKELKIPVFYRPVDLDNWRDNKYGND